MHPVQSAPTPVEKPSVSHDHAATPAFGKKGINWKALATAAGLAGAGLLLHQIPKQKVTGKWLISSDWKDIARVILGIGTVQKVNEGFGWKPPAWLGAIETVAIMNPIATGILTHTGGFSFKMLGDTVVMSALLAPMVQLTTYINETAIPWTKENLKIPSWVPQVGITAGMIYLGLKVYPKVLKGLYSLEWFKKLAQEESQAMTATVGAITCSRACCAGSILCLTEIGEMLTALKNSITGKSTDERTHSHDHH